MKKLNRLVQMLIVSLFIATFTYVFLMLNGSTYTLKKHVPKNVTSIDQVTISISGENFVECTERFIENEDIILKLKSKSEGKALISLFYEDGTEALETIYVHKGGIITVNEFMGDCSGCSIIPISVALIFAFALYLLIQAYKESVKENMYQYKNILYLGLIVFVSGGIISQFFTFISYRGLIATINEFINMFGFSIIILPIAFFVSILVIISNISLVRKEGFNITNILGIILGSFLCFATFLPELLYNVLYASPWIDIHNQSGLGLYLYNLVEAIIVIGVTYIECILIATIISGIKAAKHIPTFNKDYIIILGCQIKKDGSLTNLLKGRVDRAIEFGKLQKEKSGKEISFVPSGGKGSDEIIAEGQAIKNYLLEQGISEDKILVDDKSKNTFENIKFSNKLIKEKNKEAKIAFSTTNYHVFRTGNIAAEQGLHIEGIGAKTKSYFWINAFVREFIATLFSEKKKHIAVLCTIILVTTFMIAITYINNNI